MNWTVKHIKLKRKYNWIDVCAVTKYVTTHICYQSITKYLRIINENNKKNSNR